uniref:Uncharacterized protein n=1 Tax=Arundo donax TaxID=35708 RepID=A0A0A9HWR8_ARUDO
MGGNIGDNLCKFNLHSRPSACTCFVQCSKNHSYVQNFVQNVRTQPINARFRYSSYHLEPNSCPDPLQPPPDLLLINLLTELR